jgi:23S rRNA (guanosine2251-2'-O)-methyltransferase
VLAALQTRPQDVLEVKLHGSQPRGAWKDVIATAERQAVRIRRDVARDEGQHSRRGRRDAPSNDRTGAGSATIKERGDVTLREMWNDVAKQDANGGGLWLALDQLQDPHNVGAIFRTAAFFGVKGIILTRDRSAPLSAATYDVAAGGTEYVPFSLQTNLSRALDAAKKSGLWILGTSEHATQDIGEFQADRPWLLVLGNEQKGMRRLTADKCDVTCRMTPHGEVASLNVSVAAALMISALTPKV